MKVTTSLKLASAALFVVTGAALFAVNAPKLSEHKAAVKAWSAPVAVYTAPITYRHDPEVATIMDSLGLDYSKLNLIYGDNPRYPNRHTASFSSPNTIYLSPQLNIARVKAAMAHEYIHYAQTLSNEDEAFYPYADQLYRNIWLYERMEGYRAPDICPNNNCIPIQAEIEAVACTEMLDIYLRADFVAWCNSHLPKRSLLF